MVLIVIRCEKINNNFASFYLIYLLLFFYADIVF